MASACASSAGFGSEEGTVLAPFEGYLGVFLLLAGLEEGIGHSVRPVCLPIGDLECLIHSRLRALAYDIDNRFFGRNRRMLKKEVRIPWISEERTSLALALFVPVLVDAFPVVPFHLDTEFLLHLGNGILHGDQGASVAASWPPDSSEIHQT